LRPGRRQENLWTLLRPLGIPRWARHNGTRLAGCPFLMAIREFTDSSGVAWRVWSTIPRSPAIYEESLRNGWLTFASVSGRRRLAPIPRGWEEASADRLELMCRVAVIAHPTGTTPDPDAPDTPLDSTEPPPPER
jgi:hypothetical protein